MVSASSGLLTAQEVDQQTVRQLLQRLSEDEGRIRSLEALVASMASSQPKPAAARRACR